MEARPLKVLKQERYWIIIIIFFLLRFACTYTHICVSVCVCMHPCMYLCKYISMYACKCAILPGECLAHLPLLQRSRPVCPEASWPHNCPGDDGGKSQPLLPDAWVMSLRVGMKRVVAVCLGDDGRGKRLMRTVMRGILMMFMGNGWGWNDDDGERDKRERDDKED